MLADDGVLRVKSAGLREQRVSLAVFSENTRFAGLLDKVGKVVFARQAEGERVFAVGGIELDCPGELSFGTGEIFAIKQACPGEVSV